MYIRRTKLPFFVIKMVTIIFRNLTRLVYYDEKSNMQLPWWDQ